MPDREHYRYSIIELHLHYYGRLRRDDLHKHLGLGSVTASRVIKAYGEEHPNNLCYSVSQKSYVWTEAFEPAHLPSATEALDLMAYGRSVSSIPCQTFGPAEVDLAPAIDEFVVGSITRAIVAGTGVNTGYVSGTSGASNKILFSHAIFKAGNTWYFRALDAHRGEYRTFRFNRVVAVSDPIETAYDNLIHQTNDVEWQDSVVLTLAPHSKHPKKEALAIDLGLQGKPVKNIHANAVTAPFVLTDLRVDCSAGAEMNPFEYPLQLMNREDLSHVNGMIIAPGYTGAD